MFSSADLNPHHFAENYEHDLLNVFNCHSGCTSVKYVQIVFIAEYKMLYYFEIIFKKAEISGD